MPNNNPPFEFNDEIVNLIAQITEKVGRLEESQQIESNLHLRKQTRIRTIKSTTAIENNTLSLKQVTDVIDGKRVLGKSEEIQEVKNAFEAYERILDYDPYDIKSFLKAHSYITASLIDSAGSFRSGDVGVFEGERVVHVGARPEFVYGLMADLLKWANETDTHPLIVSAVVHYEIEYIHPFEDGNGRIGRLWQTVILSHWKNIFHYVPIETIVYKHQDRYYEAIVESRKEGLANKFVLFMLRSINEALDELDDLDITDIVTDIVTEKLSPMERRVLLPLVKYLLKYEMLDNMKAQSLTGKGAESTKKYLNKFVKYNILIPVGENKGRKYRLNQEVLK